jgi:hypothetical protein
MLFILAAGLVAASQPRELGKVPFLRDFAAAKAEAAGTGKPLFILFDEVPGCRNCTSFGEAVLSNDIVVSALAGNFVSVAIYNNESGADRVMLEHFGEPAWNNPVVRIMDGDERELTPRISDTYAAEPVARAMVSALQKVGRPVPAYLRTLAQGNDGYDPFYVLAACFWSAEACLGSLDSVSVTRVGYIGQNEVVEVQASQGHDKVSVIAEARKAGCAVSEVSGRFRFSESDDKYALRDGRFAKLHLTPAQATRVNSAIARNTDPAPYLTPAQRRELNAR